MAEENKDIGSDGVPMELPIVQYNIIDIFSGLSPAVCPRCLWRGLVETPSEFLAEDFFCQECLKNNEEVGLVGDVHWEASARTIPQKRSDTYECCEEFKNGNKTISLFCENSELNGLGRKLPPIRFCPWCGSGPILSKNIESDVKYSKEELKKWWKARCPRCGWKGLSRDCNGGNPLADTGDYSDVVCPICDSIVEDD